MSKPSEWLKYCDGALKQARAMKADYLILVEETPDGIKTGSVLIGDGPGGAAMRSALEQLVKDGLAVRLADVASTDKSPNETRRRDGGRLHGWMGADGGNVE